MDFLDAQKHPLIPGALAIKRSRKDQSIFNLDLSNPSARVNVAAARIAAAFVPACYRTGSNFLLSPIFENRSVLRFEDGSGPIPRRGNIDTSLVDIIDVIL